MSNCAQILTVDLNNHDKLIQVKVKILFQNSIQDCDKVESNSIFYLLTQFLRGSPTVKPGTNEQNLCWISVVKYLNIFSQTSFALRQGLAVY